MNKWLIFVLMMTCLAFSAKLGELDIFLQLGLPFADKPNMSKEDLTAFKNEYKQKALKLQSKSCKYKLHDLDADVFFVNKININANDEFLKFGVDVVASRGGIYYSEGNTDYKINTIFSDVVAIGYVSKYNINKRNSLPKIATFKITEILLDKGYLGHGKIDSIKIGFSSYFDAENGKEIRVIGEPQIQIGDTVIFFGYVNNIYYSFHDREAIVPYMFHAEDIMVVHNGKFSNYNSGGKNMYDVKEVIEAIKRVDKINDSYNFYKRSYK